MSVLPIVTHQCCELTRGEVEFAANVAANVIAAHPELHLDPLFDELVATPLVDAPTLHVDDLTEIQNTPNSRAFYQERARLRAMNGDLLATSSLPIEGYEPYCQEALGLGEVQWLTPDCGKAPLNLVESCYTDRSVRREIIRHVRQQGLKYIHPHIGSRAIWELALLIREASHLPIEVISPPPALSRFVNDKGAFTRLMQLMFGDGVCPPTEVVWNVANAASRLQNLRPSARYAVMKLPRGAGGGGNLLLASDDVRGRSLAEVDDLLRKRLPTLNYESCDELLVTLWVEDLLASPSVQLWIPPLAQARPILEGIFTQVVEPSRGRFVGFSPAELPSALHEQVTRQCLQIAHVFQLLGYVGRCSIDLLLVGPSFENSEIRFLECNGRWGGTSLPMTLMNRVFSDWQRQPFSSRTIKLEGVDGIRFDTLLDVLGENLFSQSTQRGNYILFNPQRMHATAEISVIALHESWTLSCDPFDAFVEKIRAGTACLRTPKNSALS